MPLLWLLLCCGGAAEAAASRTVRVGRSSAANASTVAAALAMVPTNATSRWTVAIEPGIYRERISTAGKGPLSLRGLGPAEQVVIAFGCSANKGTGKPGCRPCPAAPGFASRATVTIASEDFVGANLTIANDACGYDAGHAAQSEALSLAADRAAFSGCRLLGGQDTLYTGGGQLRSYFWRSFINGSCDSICEPQHATLRRHCSKPTLCLREDRRPVAAVFEADA